jgi:hypothetical protein
LPSVITQTRSAIFRTMPRSWVMNSIAMPRRLLRSARSFRICACTGHVERRGGLVGDEEVGLVRERNRDHHPLALAARELVRVGVEAIPASRMPTRSRSSSVLARAALSERPRWRVRISPTWRSTGVKRVERGHRLLEHHGDVVAAHLSQLVLGERQEVAALEQDCGPTDGEAGG